jgi:hypothetical protein
MKIIVVSIIAILVLHTTGLMAQQFGSVAGTFSNENLTIQLNGENGNYTGQAIMNGMSFPVTIQSPDGKSIQGSYNYQEYNFPIYGTLEGRTMSLVIDGFTFTLERQSNAPAKAQPAAQASSSSQTTKEKISGTEIGDPNLGFKFIPPAGWTAQKTESGYLLVSNSEKGFLLIIPHQYTSLESMQTGAAEGLADENGTVLQLNGAAQKFGKMGIEARFQGTVQWQQAKAFAIGLLSPFGGGMTIFAIAESASYNQNYETSTRSIANSVKFFKPEIPPVVNEWKQKLSNCRLTYLWSYYSGGGTDGSYVGGSQKTVIDLCAKGNFRFFDDSQVAADGGGASGYSGGSSNGDGTWEVSNQGQAPVLHLKFHDGKALEYALSLQDGKTFLNDKRFFRTYSDDENAEYRPQCW